MSTDITFPRHLCFDRQLAASASNLSSRGESEAVHREQAGGRYAHHSVQEGRPAAHERWLSGASFSHKPDLAYVHLKGSLPLEPYSAQEALLWESALLWETLGWGIQDTDTEGDIFIEMCLFYMWLNTLSNWWWSILAQHGLFNENVKYYTSLCSNQEIKKKWPQDDGCQD